MAHHPDIVAPGSAVSNAPEPRRHVVIGRLRGVSDPETLQAFVSNPSWRVRRTLAYQPMLTDAALRALVKDPHHRVRTAAIQHPMIALEHLAALADESHPSVRSLLLGHLRAPTAVLGSLAAHEDSDGPFHRRLVLDPRTDATVLVNAATASVRSIAASSPLSVELQMKLCADEALVTQHLAASPWLTAQAQQLLAQNPDEATRMRVARRSDLLDSVAERLRKDTQPVREVLACNPSVNKRLLVRLARDQARIRRCVAMNPSAPTQVLCRLARDRRDIGAAAAANPSLPPKLLIDMATWAGNNVRCGVARSPNIASMPHESLRALSAYGPASIVLASNPYLPGPLALELAHRPNKGMGSYAMGVALRHPSLLPGDIERLAQRVDLAAWQLVALAHNPSTPEPLRDELLAWVSLGGAPGDPAFDPLNDTGNPGNPAEEHEWSAVDRLARDEPFDHPLPRVRARKIGNLGTCPHSELLRIACDDSVAVRHAVLGFQPLTADLVNMLCDDPDPWVADRASRSQTIPSPATVKRDRRIQDTALLYGGMWLVATIVAVILGVVSAFKGEPSALPAVDTMAALSTDSPKEPSRSLNHMSACLQIAAGGRAAWYDIVPASGSTSGDPALVALGNYDGTTATWNWQQATSIITDSGRQFMRATDNSVPLMELDTPSRIVPPSIDERSSRDGRLWMERSGNHFVVFLGTWQLVNVRIGTELTFLDTPWRDSDCVVVDDDGGAVPVQLALIDLGKRRKVIDNRTVDVILPLPSTTAPMIVPNSTTKG